MKRNFLLIMLFFIFTVPFLDAKEFRYRYEDGSRYRITSVVSEDIFVNSKYYSSSNILNKVVVEIEGFDNYSGIVNGKFTVTENLYEKQGKKGGLFAIPRGNIYNSKFKRDEFGVVSEDEDDYMPVVRNVPRFPDKDLEVGDTWSAEGYEVHDFRDLIGISEPFRFPITVSYKYLEEIKYNNKFYDKLEINYSVLYNVPKKYKSKLVPTKIVGASKQKLLWDNVKGRAYAYKESFDLFFFFDNGVIYEFKGSAEAIIDDIEEMDKDGEVKNLLKALEKDKDVLVKKTDEGVSLTLNNINFVSDREILLEGEDKKVDKIIEILKDYPDRNIKIVGHTAKTGNDQEEFELSKLRAAVVAEMIINSGVKSNVEVLIEGKGSTEPIAPNNNEINMAKNRRVEIIILEE